MKRIAMLFLVLLAAAAVADAATVVLVVNGVGITDADLAQARRSVMAGQQGQTADDETVLRRALEQLIGHTLLVQAARESGAKVERAEIDSRLAAMRARYPSAEAFAQALQSSGTSEADLARREEENLLIMRFTESTLGAKATVTDAEARAYYDEHPAEFDHPEQVKVRMILVGVPDVASVDADNDAKVKAAQAVSRLAAGEEFAKVAAEVSDDPSKARGGEVGWVRRGQLLPELEAAVFDLKPGEYSQVVRSKFGYHVMGVAERRGPGRTSFAEAQPMLMGMLKGLKVREAMRQTIADRRVKAKIETVDPAIRAALANPGGGR